MQIIEAFFVINKKQDHNTGRHTHSQSKNVNSRKNLAFPDIPPGGFEVISYHLFISLCHWVIKSFLPYYFINDLMTRSK
jgi:hypothetical protein